MNKTFKNLKAIAQAFVLVSPLLVLMYLLSSRLFPMAMAILVITLLLMALINFLKPFTYALTGWFYEIGNKEVTLLSRKENVKAPSFARPKEKNFDFMGFKEM